MERLYLCMGIVTGVLSDSVNRSQIIASIRSGGLHRDYVVLLRNYLNEVLAATEEVK